LDFLKEHAGPRVWLAIFMTGALGLRCSEALTLKAEHVALEGQIPKITIMGLVPGALKSPGEVYVRKQHIQLLRQCFKTGVSTKRARGHKYGKGRKKTVTYTEHWLPPKDGYLFVPRDAGTKKGHMTYHAVYKHVKRQAKAFAIYLQSKGHPVGPELTKLRPHSGRATLITQLMGEGMCTAMSMKYARHAPESFKVHLKYGRLTLDDVKAACDALESSRKKTKWTALTTKELIQAKADIEKELSVRLKRAK
jgi:integrase